MVDHYFRHSFRFRGQREAVSARDWQRHRPFADLFQLMVVITKKNYAAEIKHEPSDHDHNLVNRAILTIPSETDAEAQNAYKTNNLSSPDTVFQCGWCLTT